MLEGGYRKTSVDFVHLFSITFRDDKRLWRAQSCTIFRAQDFVSCAARGFTAARINTPGTRDLIFNILGFPLGRVCRDLELAYVVSSFRVSPARRI